MTTSPIAVTGGLVQGHTESDPTITVFRGIPYAAPPLGPYRFRPPQPVTPWEGVRECTQNSAVNYQLPPPPKFYDTLVGVPQSEDILYLNVWVPDSAKHDGPYPVFFWMHGGGFREGGNADKNFNGTGLAQKGVIVVVPNFRLGMLGFLAHPELSKAEPSGASGNQGILDCIQALQWIQENIAAFGGDPGRVTIGGQSSGSAMTTILLFSPITKGLFHRACIQSGVRSPQDQMMPTMAPSYRQLQHAEEDGVALLRELGFSSLEEARKHPDPLLFARAALKRDARYWGPPPFFRAVLDGHVFVKPYHETLRDGPPNDIPILTGQNANESGVYAEPRFTLDDFHQCVHERVGAAFEDRYRAVYPLANTEMGQGPLETWNLSAQEQTRVSTSEWARLWKTKASSPVFGYYFTHAPPAYHGFKPDFSAPKVAGFTQNKGPLTGAFHGAEFAYTFNSVVTSDMRPWTDRDRYVGEVVSTLWSNFIKHGDPNQGRPERVARWPALTEDPTTMLELGGEFDTISIARPEAIDFWTSFIQTGEAW
ncbi:hypothetical protein ASPZODRAFT_134563 [Penicilliopsis zonata CBS 506.65]|uniref:Carboxylic ester hydrolase n=1 Tax=Penicilliopsis zonata CBS 506.65 TaxID=1073090 RepID=A0A1L9SD44_9EURO|nr:hypothetical protein ASPZODRAFT_134563 [Penicilliopsis zonata CBS 506.65]OJJ45145.1 hypothetical protein ASPZODRAFT_134563 [Penicilliopsis zonata CBS 506.65]